MDDLISRQAAIRWVKTECNPYGKPTLDFESGKKVIEHLKQMPSAQPDSKELSGTHKALDTVSRQAVIEAINKIFPADPMRDDYTQGITCGAALANIYVAQLPSAQPERLTDYSFDESCTECPAYDTENHRCPRFNQVIRTALKDANLEPCENCISRQAVIDALDEQIALCDKALKSFGISMRDEYAVKVERASLVAFRETLEYLLPAEPKTGRWIYCEDTTADCVDGYRCDQCGLFVPWDYQHKSIDYIKDYNFCPNCGAKMEE